MQSVMTSPDSEEIRSLTALLLPLTDRTLIVPNVAVAELIPYRAPQGNDDLPDWFLGLVNWRDLRLPLLSFEVASGEPAVAAGNQARILVLNAQGGRSHVKFIALLVQGIPRAMKVDSELAAADVPLAALELAAVDADGIMAKIPDLLALENMLAEHGII